ncbi:MAG: DNA-binding response OmpR family regulator [Planctomycetota bacterium]|jgi:DNA-binding response OmpR family regulator
MEPSESKTRKRILIAEDEQMLRETLVEVLTEAGYDVIATADGAEARDKALELKPDLLLLDIQMPLLSGLEALKMIRGTEWGATVPVVLLTNMGDVRNISGAIDLQAHDYLIKADISLDKVIETIHRKLNPDPRTSA